MMNLYHVDDPNLTLYAKPLPLDSDPSWGDDAISPTETSGTYAFTVTDGVDYLIYQQDGASPANTDTAIAQTATTTPALLNTFRNGVIAI